MGPPLWPDRSSYRIGSTPETVAILSRWAAGARIHPYGLTALEQYGYDACTEHPCHLDVRGTRDGGGFTDALRWSVYGWRNGATETADRVHCSGYSDAGDACYAALHLIEEQEREDWEAALVLGLA